MINGANAVHKKLRQELENYIKTQYFRKTPVLLNAIDDRLDEEGLLYQKPYIESNPAYISVTNGINDLNIPSWLKDMFLQLCNADLGVYNAPYKHQLTALEYAFKGSDLFVSTGTGSGKTECFIWPLLAKLAAEAHDHPLEWNNRGVRVVIMYPMNALVSDQLSRLRKLFGDSEGKFIEIFRSICKEK